MITVRTGELQDLESVLNLIKELADYEHSLDQVQNTVQMMEKDGFGNNPIFGFVVAEESAKIIGTAIYYYRYSTWKGKRLYLEDIVITKKRRREGIGKKLFDAVIQVAKDSACSGMMWQVLDWNESAIRFYKKHYQTQFEDDWLNCHLDF